MHAPLAADPTAPYRVVRAQTEDQQATFVLDSYLLHVHTSRCACGAEYRWSTIQEVWVHPRGNIRNLKPATTLRSGLKIGNSVLLLKEQPVCHECIDRRARAGDASIERIESEARWRQTIVKKYAAPASSAPRAPSTPKPTPRLEDI